MPTYEYLCKTCSHRFETWQKMTDEPLTICPECGGHIRRVLYPAGVVFKGSGFYKTDHRNGSTPNESQETKAATAESNGSSESKESKPAESGTNGSSPSTPTNTSTNESKPAANVA